MSDRETITVTSREMDTIFAALRYWQRRDASVRQREQGIAEGERRSDDAALSAAEIDALCDRINFGEIAERVS